MFFIKKLDEIFITTIQLSLWYEIINKRAGPNKQAGWNFLKKLINEQGQIRACRMEKPQIINKRACSIIRQITVLNS